MPDDISDEDQEDDEPRGPAVEKTSIDDVVLGAPIHEDSDATVSASHPPIARPIIGVTRNPKLSLPQHHQIEAGCLWDRDNWSCSYDVVFMLFWFVYRSASPEWREKWKQQAPKWNKFLGEAFDALLAMAQHSSQEALSHAFTSFRETFRDELSRINPGYFPRRGQVLASVCHIFSHIFSGSTEYEPHLEQVIACDRCNTSTTARSSFTLLGSSSLLEIHHHEDDVGPFLPLQTAVTRYIQYVSQEPTRDHCRTCSGPLRVDSLSMPETTWVWIELCDEVSPIAPSSRLVFGLQDQRQVYALQAVIYLGGGHFTARLLDQSATWWNYDGMWRFGAPHVDRVEDEVDLLKNGDRRAAFLVYCRVDCPD